MNYLTNNNELTSEDVHQIQQHVADAEKLANLASHDEISEKINTCLSSDALKAINKKQLIDARVKIGNQEVEIKKYFELKQTQVVFKQDALFNADIAIQKSAIFMAMADLQEQQVLADLQKKPTEPSLFQRIANFFAGFFQKKTDGATSEKTQKFSHSFSRIDASLLNNQTSTDENVKEKTQEITVDDVITDFPAEINNVIVNKPEPSNISLPKCLPSFFNNNVFDGEKASFQKQLDTMGLKKKEVKVVPQNNELPIQQEDIYKIS